MEVLIVLATVIAYVYSVVIVVINMVLKVSSPMLFFDVAPSKTILVFLLIESVKE